MKALSRQGPPRPQTISAACHTISTAAEQGFENLSGAKVDGPCARSDREEAKTFYKCNL